MQEGCSQEYGQSGKWEARESGHALRQQRASWILPWTVTKLEVLEEGGFAQQVE